jgi:hypothetical protein
MSATPSTHSSWDTNSGVRERLALLAELGPDLIPSSWGYNPTSDVWYYCGPHSPSRNVRRIRIVREAAESLRLIAQRGLDQASAMTFIGHPPTAPAAAGKEGRP